MKEPVGEIRSIIESARTNAVRSVDFCRVQMYWRIGQRIVEEEQGGPGSRRVWKGADKEPCQRNRTRIWKRVRTTPIRIQP